MYMLAFKEWLNTIFGSTTDLTTTRVYVYIVYTICFWQDVTSYSVCYVPCHFVFFFFYNVPPITRQHTKKYIWRTNRKLKELNEKKNKKREPKTKKLNFKKRQKTCEAWQVEKKCFERRGRCQWLLCWEYITKKKINKKNV